MRGIIELSVYWILKFWGYNRRAIRVCASLKLWKLQCMQCRILCQMQLHNFVWRLEFVQVHVYAHILAIFKHHTYTWARSHRRIVYRRWEAEALKWNKWIFSFHIFFSIWILGTWTWNESFNTWAIAGNRDRNHKEISRERVALPHLVFTFQTV